MKKALLFLLLLSLVNIVYSQFQTPKSKSDTSIYILSCSPGHDLYSVFGHTAIMVKTPASDWVYNYGTFDFDTENFYVKFARGKLLYKLAKEQFGYFQYSYIREQRGIIAQQLNFSPFQKEKMIRLLEENVLLENAYYKYDFFYDNCATRVRDMINEASDHTVNWNQLEAGNGHTFREMIQEYLYDMEWSDLGIDLALGIPCDKELKENEQDFLPDSLLSMISKATIGGTPLSKREFEVLPEETIQITKKFKDHPFKVLTLISAVLFGFVLFFRNSKKARVLSAVILVMNGLIGLVVFVLWFLTDHQATAANLNIIWANPLNLLLPFVKTTRRKWLKVYSLSVLLLLIGWVFLPQDLHESLLPLIGLTLLSALVYGRTLNH